MILSNKEHGGQAWWCRPIIIPVTLGVEVGGLKFEASSEKVSFRLCLKTLKTEGLGTWLKW
jgi:hypothetical protein